MNGGLLSTSKRLVRLSVAAVAAAALIFLATGCELAGGGPPLALEIEVSQERIRSGQSVTLSWVAPSNSTVTLNGERVNPSGIRTDHNLQTTRTYLFQASRGFETIQTQRQILVDVTQIRGAITPPPLPLHNPEPLNDDDIIPGQYLLLLDPSAILPASLHRNTQSIAPELGLYLLHHNDLNPMTTTHTLDLLNTPGVLGITPNRLIRPLTPVNDEHWNRQWHLNGATAPRFDITPLWQRTTGTSDVTIAIVDSGIAEDPNHPGQPHPDLHCNRLLPGISFLNTRNGTTHQPGAFEPPSARLGYHGTHVTGIAAACTNNDIGIAGVDHHARIQPIRVFDDNGRGTLAEILAAAAWAAGIDIPNLPTNPHPADIINFSLGAGGLCNDATHPVASALSSITARGIILIAAAGNSGSTNALVPANCPTVISVGATNPSGLITTYSNRGPLVDIYAPGGDMRGGQPPENGILAPLADQDGQPRYGYMEGTSMAAPMITGLIALLRSEHPTLTTTQARTMLQTAADPITTTCRINNTTQPCTGLVIDLPRLATSVLPDLQPIDHLLVVGSTDLGARSETILTLVNTGDASIEMIGVEVSSSALEASLYGSYVIPPGGSRSVVVALNRSLISGAEGLGGVRSTEMTLVSRGGSRSVRLTFDTGGSSNLGDLSVEASVIPSNLGFAERRRVSTVAVATLGYSFELDLNLSALDLRPGDLIVLRTSTALSAANPNCSNPRVEGELRFPVGEPISLIYDNRIIATELVCGRP